MLMPTRRKIIKWLQIKNSKTNIKNSIIKKKGLWDSHLKENTIQEIQKFKKCVTLKV